SICATCTPGASRKASGMLVAPARLMSSCVMTNTAAGVCDSNCGLLETVVTSICVSSSRLNSETEASCAGDCAGLVTGTNASTANTKIGQSNLQGLKSLDEERLRATN